MKHEKNVKQDFFSLSNNYQNKNWSVWIVEAIIHIDIYKSDNTIDDLILWFDQKNKSRS